MKVAMIILSFVIAYPLFMLMVYYLGRLFFIPPDKVAAEQQRERLALLMKAKRVRRKERFVHA